MMYHALTLSLCCSHSTSIFLSDMPGSIYVNVMITNLIQVVA
jgi:hypothetical protein